MRKNLAEFFSRQSKQRGQEENDNSMEIIDKMGTFLTDISLRMMAKCF